MKRLACLMGALVALVCAVPASATTLFYSVTNTSGFSASFALDDHPTPNPYLTESYAFFLTDVPGTYSDGSALAGLSFYDDSQDGGMSLVTANFTTIDFAGIALFTGSTDAPTLFAFAPTSFTGVEDGLTYTVSAVAGAVPEPATWAMLILGFGVVGVAVRRRAPAGQTERTV